MCLFVCLFVCLVCLCPNSLSVLYIQAVICMRYSRSIGMVFSVALFSKCVQLVDMMGRLNITNDCVEL